MFETIDMISTQAKDNKRLIKSGKSGAKPVAGVLVMEKATLLPQLNRKSRRWLDSLISREAKREKRYASRYADTAY